MLYNEPINRLFIGKIQLKNLGYTLMSLKDDKNNIGKHIIKYLASPNPIGYKNSKAKIITALIDPNIQTRS